MLFSKIPVKHLTNVSIKYQIRNKASSALNPQAERVVNQLSVMSAGRKQPRLLKLCNEDYIKHKTVMRAWSLYRNEKISKQQEKLKTQYESMEEAAIELKSISENLYQIANKHQHGKRFPLEIRVPTEYPPRNIWFYDYFPKVNNKQ